MRYVTRAALAVVFAWLAYAPAAEAQIVCGERAKVAEALKKGHAESPVSMGLSSLGAVVEVFASANGSWTIVMTRPNGMSCLLAAGEGREELPRRAVDTRT